MHTIIPSITKQVHWFGSYNEMDNINGQNILLNKLGKHQSALVADYNREYGIHGHKSPGSIILKTNDHAK
jgi:hypothetical protein